MRFVLLLIQLALLGGNVKAVDIISHEWAGQWYIGEPYELVCNVTANITDFHVTWDTPTQKGLSWDHNGKDYQIMNEDGTYLLIKAISPELHGVYVCNVHDNKSKAVVERQIHGLNIHEEKFRNSIDKYRHNLKVGGIAAGSFLGMAILLSIIWTFRYQDKENSRDNPKRKLAHAHQTDANGSGSTVYENAAFEDVTKM